MAGQLTRRRLKAEIRASSEVLASCLKQLEPSGPEADIRTVFSSVITSLRGVIPATATPEGVLFLLEFAIPRKIAKLVPSLYQLIATSSPSGRRWPLYTLGVLYEFLVGIQTQLGINGRKLDIERMVDQSLAFADGRPGAWFVIILILCLYRLFETVACTDKYQLV